MKRTFKTSDGYRLTLKDNKWTDFADLSFDNNQSQPWPVDMSGNLLCGTLSEESGETVYPPSPSLPVWSVTVSTTDCICPDCNQVEEETPWLYSADANQAVRTTIDALYRGKYQGKSLHSHPDAMRDLANMLYHFVAGGAIEWDISENPNQNQ